MIKTIAIDMDGTLLNKMQKVSDENKAAIQRAQREGVEVIIATGRSYEEAKYALDETGIVCPIICVNGAAIFTQDGKIAASNPMSLATAQSVAEYLEEQEIYFEIYTSQGIYSKDYENAISALVDVFVTANPDIDPVGIRKFAEDRLQLGQVKSVSNYSDLFSHSDKEYYKILSFSKNLSKLDQIASQLKTQDGVTVTSSGRENVEIMSGQAQKGTALEKYVTKKSASMQETMAIGDNYNDISMFERVGLSVAMGNAPLDIQKLCDEVTGINDDHGVATAILKVLTQSSAY
ncbi:Cof-type HAD-IIB family hydrolase [Peribacillus sp. R9-11]|uniref:Cof-type HAD-IIB family hydrolase n=1 Tax=Peribacillus sp. R9-11 TaxID=3073271 RepID=UPI002868A131|nr:Cof-type HAD-IIB family hydrolase [Peribacillus sp. R9-11]WMX55616.1 Cof-type HAD-IIB family hydrolase [Peribacillus sp. R9-11]